MKNIRIILLGLTLMISSVILAQRNSLSTSEYSNLKFDNVAIQDIINTNGATNAMQSLFNNTLVVEKGFNDAVEHWIKFSTNSICIEFYNGVKNGSITTYDLANIDVQKNTSKLRVKNKQIKLGDSGATLSSFNSRSLPNEKIYTFGLSNFDSYAYIHVNKSSNKVTKIGYNGNLL